MPSLPPPLPDSNRTGLKTAQEITADSFDGDVMTRPQRDIALGGGTLRSDTIEAFDGKIDNRRVAAAFDGQITEEDRALKEADARDLMAGSVPALASQDIEPPEPEKKRSLPSPWHMPKPSPYNR